jgi:ArsR family transcriptional regulator
MVRMRAKKKAPPSSCCDDRPLALAEDAASERLAELAWALAHPARVRIVRLLLERDNCVCGEIVGQLPLAQSTVSQHLKILKQAGVVVGEVDGPKVCYEIRREALEELRRVLVGLGGVERTGRSGRGSQRSSRA